MRRGDTRRLVLAAATAAGLALAGVAGGATWTPSLVSTGDEPGNGAFDAGVVAVSPDATRILFSTPEPLLAADGDASPDVYLRTGGVTSLLTDGPLAPPVRLLASASSGRVVFATAEALAAGADNDTAVDVYLRDGTATTLVSANPPAGNASTDVTLLAISADGTRIIFATSEALDTTSDTDTRADVYVYELGAATPLTHVSSGAVNGDGPFDVTFQATSDDGSRILFQTAEPLEAGDTDGSVADLYQWSAGVTTLVSGNGVPASPADSPVLSRDGTRVLFRTEEQLTGGDTDSLHDVYVWNSGVTSLVTGPGVTDIGASFPVAFSADGSRAYVRSVDQLLSADVDNAYDLYEWSGGTLRLLSPGPGVGASEPTFLAAADDGSHVLFATAEQLAAADTDVRLDVYERTATATTLVSAGGTGVDDIDTALVSADGSRAFFVTSEQLVAEDTDTALDVYERSAGETRLVSVGGGTGNVDLAAVSADGSRAVLTTGLSLVPADTEARADVYLATLEPDPPPSSPPPAPAAPPPAPPPPPPAPPSAATSEAVRAGAARPVRYRLTMDAAGAVRMRLICVGRPRATCAGTVRLTTRNRQLRQVLIGRGSFSFTKPARPQLTIVLTPAGRRLVREGAQRQAVLVVSTRVPGAKPSAFSATVTLVRARAQAARGSPGAARERSPGLG